ncbi:MAG TPA: flavodoxin family protein [Symbiobacteriaceae bacterium]|nr:flavodoxin family protein [Symbiobacteriaceae bacterium]
MQRGIVKVLGIIGSPRPGGNSDVVVSEVLRGAGSQGAEVEKVYLNDLNIRGCQACDVCKHGKGYVGCIQDDDMFDLYEKLIAADAVVLGCPIYCFGPSAQLKAFIDRWYALFYYEQGKRVCQLSGKKMLPALLYGEADPFFAGAANAFAMLRDQAAFCGMTIPAVIFGSADAPGEIRKNGQVMAEAYRAGERLLMNP